MTLTEEQQKAFEQMKEKINEIDQMFANSLNLQAYGGWAVRNLVIDLQALVKKVEAQEEESE